MIPDFEANSSDWRIRISLREILEVHLTLSAINQKMRPNHVVWLTKGENGKRLWIIRDRSILSWVTADGESTDPTFALPIPELFLDQLMEMISGGDGIDLFCNEVEGTIVARADNGSYLSIDHPQNVEFRRQDLPYLGNPHREDSTPAIATVGMLDIVQFAKFLFKFPSGVDWPPNDVMPFVAMALDKDTLAWTMDWRRQDSYRFTGSVPASTVGAITATFYPYQLAAVLLTKDRDGDARIFIDGDNAEYAYFVGDDWGIRILLDAEYLARWNHKVVRELKNVGVDVDNWKSQQIPSYMTFTLNQSDTCYVSLHQSDDLSVTVRLTAILSDDVPESLSVYSEINNLNDTLVGARVSLREDEVRLVVEFPAEGITNMASHLLTFTKALAQCKDVHTFLPLFAE
jgi:hypothetical protein